MKACHLVALPWAMLWLLHSVAADGVYTAYYFGRFRILTIDAFADFDHPWPEVKAFCVGEISLIDVLPSFPCTVESTTDEPGFGSEIHCDMKDCTETNTLEACQSMVGVDEKDINKNWGTVAFTCSGPRIEDTKGAFSFEDNGDGSLGSSFLYDNLRLFRRAQLGIKCGSDDAAVYLSEYFECGGEAGPRLGRRKGSSEWSHYICEWGKVCQDCDVDFERVLVEADVHRFSPDCFGYSGDDNAPLVLPPAPAPPPTPAGTYTIEYAAKWRLFEWRTATRCVYSDRLIKIACAEGSVISFVEALQDSVSCVPGSSANELVCTDRGGDSATTSLSFMDEDYSGAIYKCTGPTPPGTSIVKERSTEPCSIVQDDGVFGTYLRIGMKCSEDYNYADHFVECTESDYSNIEDVGRLYSCYTDTFLPESGDTINFPRVAMATDHRLYEYGQYYECFDFDPSNIATGSPTRSPSRYPTDSPTSGPTTNPVAPPSDMPTASPSATPTPGPTATPTGNPTASPTSGPTAAPTAGPTFKPSEESSLPPSGSPTAEPTVYPTARDPSMFPTANPIACPTSSPSSTLSGNPSLSPTSGPTGNPTAAPTTKPSHEPPSAPPSREPTLNPAMDPSMLPTAVPSGEPLRGQPGVDASTDSPTLRPSKSPVVVPATSAPTKATSTVAPSKAATTQAPTPTPSGAPSTVPSTQSGRMPFESSNIFSRPTARPPPPSQAVNPDDNGHILVPEAPADSNSVPQDAVGSILVLSSSSAPSKRVAWVAFLAFVVASFGS